MKPKLSDAATVRLFNDRHVDGVVREQDFADFAEQDVDSLNSESFREHVAKTLKRGDRSAVGHATGQFRHFDNETIVVFAPVSDQFISRSHSMSFPNLERLLQIGFTHCGRPDSADDDGVAAHRVNNFPSTKDQFAPAALAQFIQDRSGFGILKQNGADGIGDIEGKVAR